MEIKHDLSNGRLVIAFDLEEFDHSG